jgi:hypothetical protein
VPVDVVQMVELGQIAFKDYSVDFEHVENDDTTLALRLKSYNTAQEPHKSYHSHLHRMAFYSIFGHFL